MQHPVRCCGQGGTVCEIFINLIADIVNTRGQELFLCLLMKMLCMGKVGVSM